MGRDRYDAIETYFSALNPIANKIHEDIRITKSTYMPVWDELNHNEQCALINKSLIRPEITHGYFKSFSSSISAVSTRSSIVSIEVNNCENKGHNERLLDFEKASSNDEIYMFDGEKLATYCRQKTGQKLIHDDMIGAFRDEHSGPFSVKTKSQLNLCLFRTNHVDELNGAAKLLKSIIFTGPKSPASRIIAAPKQTAKRSEAEQGSSIGQKCLYSKLSVPNTHCTHEDYKDQQSVCMEICIDKLTVLALRDSNDKLMSEVAGDEQLSQEIAEQKCLMKSVSCDADDLMSSLNSAEDDEKSTFEDESRLLLDASSFDLRKGFEFLNNW